MRVLCKSLQIAAGAMLFAGVIYLLVAAPGVLTNSASTIPLTSAQGARE